MPFKTYFIDARQGENTEEEMNRFIRSHRVVGVERKFVSADGQTGWAFCVEFTDGVGPTSDSRGSKKKPRVDYKEVLNEADFAVFARLREWRKAKAAEKGVPMYVLFTNEQLAAIARERPATKAALKEMEGLGPARMEHAEDVFDVVKNVEGGDVAAGAAV